MDDSPFLLQVRHAVQGWILDPRLNLGLEVEGDVEVGRATLHINTKVGRWGLGFERVKIDTKVTWPAIAFKTVRPSPLLDAEIHIYRIFQRPCCVNAVKCIFTFWWMLTLNVETNSTNNFIAAQFNISLYYYQPEENVQTCRFKLIQKLQLLQSKQLD